jgi:DNA adenine methylase
MIDINIKTPITYYGGKQKMLPLILPLIPAHRIYTEAFLGGGAVFWAKQPSKVEFINDHDGEVINFYCVLKSRFPELRTLIEQSLHSEYQQKQCKEIYLHPEGHNEIERAWAIWLLSHQSFYAILDNTWMCSKSRNKAAQVQRDIARLTDAYAKRLTEVSIFCRDALDVIRKTDDAEAFHYVDPPYYQADMGHYGGYTLEDFEALLRTLATLKGKFLLSSYPSKSLFDAVKANGWYVKEFKLHRDAGSNTKIEVLTANYPI